MKKENTKDYNKWQNVHIPHVLLFFALSWLWAAFYYGDVFLMAREYSFFAFDKTLMYPVWEQEFGTLRIAGRFLLNLFAMPWLGALALSGILTASCWLLGSITGLKRGWKSLQYIPAFAYMLWITWKGYNAYVFNDPGLITGIPFCALVTLLVMYLFAKSFGKHYIGNHHIHKADSIIISVVIITMTLSVIAYCEYFRDDVRTTARMHRLMWQKEWDKMAKTAEEWEGSSRQVAAYHAIALMRNGRLLDDLFKVRYDYEPIHLTSRKGEPSEGREIYEADCNFHAGLVQSAYRNDMEQTTLDGVASVRLRRMIRYAVLTGERNLALKYLHVLSQQPFEKDFTERYRLIAMSPSEAKKDEELYAVSQMIPQENSFEGSFARPLFIGYYLGTESTVSRSAHDAATAASLYARMMPLFCYRAVEYAREGHYPAAVADALGMLKVTNPESVSAFNVPESNIARFMSFAREFNGNDTTAVRNKAKSRYESYKGYYPYYIYFGHSDNNNTDF